MKTYHKTPTRSRSRSLSATLKSLIRSNLNEEQKDWLRLTPRERYLESCKLWSTYLVLGGRLDPEPDSQSPFDFPEMRREMPAHGSLEKRA